MTNQGELNLKEISVKIQKRGLKPKEILHDIKEVWSNSRFITGVDSAAKDDSNYGTTYVYDKQGGLK